MANPIIAIRKDDAYSSNRKLAATLQQTTCYSCGVKLLATHTMIRQAVQHGQAFVCPACPRAVLAIRKMELERLCVPAKHEAEHNQLIV